MWTEGTLEIDEGTYPVKIWYAARHFNQTYAAVDVLAVITGPATNGAPFRETNEGRDWYYETPLGGMRGISYSPAVLNKRRLKFQMIWAELHSVD